MRRALGFAVLLGAGTASADTFGGFSSIDAPYLVNQDRVCVPLEVTGGKASGTPTCEKAATDDIAHLTVKPGTVESGAKAMYAATASGRTLTVTKDGGAAVVWTAADPIGKVVEVYSSQYADRVAVAYTTRRLGTEVTSIVAFVIVKTTGKEVGGPSTVAPITPPPVTTPPKEDPAVTKALDAARKASKAKALAAWQAVQALDADNSEARYRIAAIHAAGNQDPVADLQALAKSTRGDAIEWLVEARFDSAFGHLRADPKFRAAVGLDKPSGTAYERLMGFGGQWEQTGTSCDAPEIRLVVKRDRSVKLNVKSSCNGQVFDMPFSGTWRLDDADHITLILPPTKHAAASNKDEAPCVFKRHGEEDALRCSVGKDLEFEVLPTRR